MPFAFQLSATRNRPIAPSVRITDDGQVHIELKRYIPKKGIPVNFFDSALYEGIQSQYERLGLAETSNDLETTRTWEGEYTANVRRYLVGLTRGKQPLPPINSIKEEDHARKSTPQTNPPDLFTSVPAPEVGTIETGFTEPGKILAIDNRRDRDGHSGTAGSNNESGQPTLFGPSPDASRGRNTSGNASHTGNEQRSKAGQLNIFDTTSDSSFFSLAEETKKSNLVESPTPLLKTVN